MKILYVKETGKFISQVREDIEVDSNTIEYIITQEDMSWLTENHYYENGFWRYSFDKTPEDSIKNGFSLIRKERDLKLSYCDWTQLPDVPLQTKEKWAEYRQALRDITLQGDPFNITWPEPPL